MNGINEFCRPYRLDTLGGARAVHVAADEKERAALAERFGLLSLAKLEADATLRREGDVVWAEGEATADYEQACIATGEPLPAHRLVPFRLRFVPEAQNGGGEEEIELSDEDCDTLEHDGGAIDLGEAVAQTLALAIDPFPRGPHADAALRDAGVIGEEDAGPFAALKALRDKL
ncbi:YceD family protein [Flavisphingomonas formosensis]|uniref:YceD family protein n=1 Tax=Flavisphingomonas formosensis TaxID=861534 RepID=UPI0012FBEBA1|nr:YceD family protein [Sphingomonas formosensis]